MEERANIAVNSSKYLNSQVEMNHIGARERLKTIVRWNGASEFPPR